MKRILLALGLLIGSIGSALAACSSPVVMHDFPGTAFNMSVLTAPDGNCATASAVQTWAGGTLGAMANYGTSPGAVLVPGVNASVTASALPTGAATSANQTTANTSLATIATNTAASVPAGAAIIGQVGIDQTTDGTTNGVRLTSLYPGGATPITASATGTTAATTATLAGTTGKTTYICSFSVRANATANANVTNTVTGVISGTLSRAMWIPANTAGLGVDEQVYTPCVPASTTNTAIAVVSGAPGTGGVVTVNATGYQR